MEQDSFTEAGVPHPRGTWFAPSLNRIVAPGALLSTLAAKPVVLLGETHDRAEIHRWQMHVAAALHARQPNMAIGFEMFPRRLQPVLDRWVAGLLDTETFLVEAEWFDVWNFDPEIYLPLFHFCRQNRVPMLALNCYRQLVSRVRREGWAAIPEAERDGLTPPAPATDAYRRYLQAVVGSMPGRHAPPEMDERFDGFVAAQQTWDRAFAVNIHRALRRPDPPLVVGIIGRGHLEFGHGTPYQLRDLGVHDMAVLVTCRPGDDPAKALAPGIADAVFHIDDVEPASPRPPRAGLRWKVGDGSLSIASIREKSPASRTGLQPGDRVTAIADRPVTTIMDAEEILRRMPTGARFAIVIRREAATHEFLIWLQSDPPTR